MTGLAVHNLSADCCLPASRTSNDALQTPEDSEPPLLSLLPLPAVSVSRSPAASANKAPGTQSPRADLTPTGPSATVTRPALLPLLGLRPGWLRSPALGVGSPWPPGRQAAWDQCGGPPAWQVHSTQGQGTSTEPEAGPASGEGLSGGDTERSRATHNRGGGKTSLTQLTRGFLYSPSDRGIAQEQEAQCGFPFRKTRN